MNYDDFLHSKQRIPPACGFEMPKERMNPMMFEWQKVASPIWEEYASPTWWDINQSDTLNRTAAREEKDERHICPLQLPVIERCVELWSNPGDIVLDPFDGIGSTGYQSLLMGRRHIGIELKESYFNLAVENCRKAEKHAVQENTEQPSLFDILEAAT